MIYWILGACQPEHDVWLRAVHFRSPGGHDTDLLGTNTAGMLGKKIIASSDVGSREADQDERLEDAWGEVGTLVKWFRKSALLREGFGLKNRTYLLAFTSLKEISLNWAIHPQRPLVLKSQIQHTPGNR